MTVLFVLASIIIFLTIDWFLHRKTYTRSAPSFSVQPQNVKAVRVPEGLFFAPSHTWISLLPSGVAQLGVDDFISRLFTKPRIQFLKTKGEAIARGEPLLKLEEGKREFTIRSPLDGTIVVENETVKNNPLIFTEEIVWEYVLKPTNAEEVTQFVLGTSAKEWMKTELQRVRDFFASYRTNGVALVYMQDGGIPTSDALNALDNAAWKQFEEQFLRVQ